MALPLNTEASGDFLPIIKYDARAGRLLRVDRSPHADGSGWGKQEIDISTGVSFLADMAHIEVGWISFQTGVPDFSMIRIDQLATGGSFPEKPSPDHRQGFRITVQLAQPPGDVRQFSHTAKCVVRAFDALHTAYVEGLEQADNKTLVPRVTLAGTTPVKTYAPHGTTTNYAPQFEITDWTPRPAAFDEVLKNAQAAGGSYDDDLPF
ncbi:MAG: hypothetical protein F4Z57_10185 [Gemmatimonadetes bacterium]|nr:hypothetical protein [Gemmatimonadota bacterium]MXW79330.1 hypothetical protein [Gemmatimonadota bacterium]MYC72296.1 hypothetical protein [Gemmatimonadota bacterium]MYI60579.1 hypothetical protein [Gemmatimonadota bacterium]